MINMRSIALVLASVVAGNASAADNGFYFGVSGGQAEYDFEPMQPLNSVVSFPYPFPIPPSGIVESYTPFARLTPVSGWSSVVAAGALFQPAEVFWFPGEDDEATSWNVLAGYRFSKFIALEVAYHDLGTLNEYSPSRTIGPITTLEVKSEMESTGATLALLGTLPITDYWNVYLRAGGLFADQDVSRRIGTLRFGDSYDSEVFLYGIGTQIDFGSHWSARLDFQRYDDVGKGNGVGEADVDVLALGVLFRL